MVFPKIRIWQNFSWIVSHHLVFWKVLDISKSQIFGKTVSESCFVFFSSLAITGFWSICDIPAAFFYRFFSAEFLVELDVTSTSLLSIWVWFLFPVLLCWGEFCCVVSVVLRCIVVYYVVLRCDVLRSVVLCLICCTALRSAVSLLCCICWVALCCNPFHCVAFWSVVLRCLVLCCIVDKFSISSIPSMLKLDISRHTQPTSLTGRQSLHQRTRQSQHLSLTLRQYEPHYTTNSLTGRQNLLISTQLDKQNDPHQTAKLNNPHLF